MNASVTDQKGVVLRKNVGRSAIFFFSKSYRGIWENALYDLSFSSKKLTVYIYASNISVWLFWHNFS